MDCPQCGAEVPSDDLFCGKCGYAMRDGGPERVDQSRIRMHEEPDPAAGEPSSRGSSQQRIRKHTVMGMPSATPPAGTRTPAPVATPPAPPTEISAARSRAKKRTPQKTMLGIPRPDFLEAPPTAPPKPSERAPGASTTKASEPEVSEPQSADASSPSHRARARVRYDSANEPFPLLQRRKKALRMLALLVVLAGAWLAYRYLSLNA
jgi:predicted nucleic acid-binding Zn ribbon protein